jgi:hypothetical protein
MRVWIDLANSPHVPLFVPIVRRLREGGDEVLLTVRDHAQTLALARDVWPHVAPIGAASPPGRVRKAVAIVARAAALHRFAARTKPDVALSHGSYAQLVAARLARVPAVTMMDYEHQPANHLSFRLARLVIVPSVFPQAALRRFGAGPEKVVRYDGFKEELYVTAAGHNGDVCAQLGVDRSNVVAVLRPPPTGALYHRGENDRFEEVLTGLEQRQDVAIVLLPRSPEQRARYANRRVTIPAHPVDGTALLAAADLVVGGGGTMTREAALLGTPTYTVFMPELAAVDAELMRLERIVDLRQPGTAPIAVKKRGNDSLAQQRGEAICATVLATLRDAVSGGG